MIPAFISLSVPAVRQHCGILSWGWDHSAFFVGPRFSGSPWVKYMVKTKILIIFLHVEFYPVFIVIIFKFIRRL